MRIRRGQFRELEKRLGYGFRRKRLLFTALIHRSHRFESPDIDEDNQRLEFLGDAVLSFVTASHLYQALGDAPEGVLTDQRSRVTSGQALARLAAGIGLGDYLMMGRGEQQSGGRTRASNLADALEAVLGAAFLDGGLRAVEKIFRKLVMNELRGLEAGAADQNPKGGLQQASQDRWKKSPRYHVIKRDGPPHAVRFTVEVTLPDGTRERGTGSSKRAAETQAATRALARLSAAGGHRRRT